MPENHELVSVKPNEIASIENSQNDFLISELGKGKGKKYVRFFMAALSGIPWIGSLIGAAAGFSAEKDQQQISDLQKLWLEEHKQKARDLTQTLNDIFSRLDGFGDAIQDRIQSEEYLTLVKRTFRSWDEADTIEKRDMLKKLITNAGAITLCPDDLIRLFINWIDLYHEAHFSVMKEIYQNDGITRGAIWDRINTERPREDSAEADLFRYLIRELSTGGVIRQARETNAYGEFMKKDTRKSSKSIASRTLESAFENTKPYELTELGKEFVRYVMEDIIPQISQ